MKRMALIPLVLIALLTFGGLFLFFWAAELIHDVRHKIHISSYE